MNIRGIRTLPELNAVRAFWEQWQSHANSDLAQFELVCRSRPEVEAPIVVVSEDDGCPQALVASRLERTTFEPAIGYAKPFRISAKVITVLHQGIIGPLSDEAASRSIQYLRSLLRDGVADAVAFHHLSEHSPLLNALQLERRAWLSERTPRWSTHREMVLSARGDFLEKKFRAKHRSQLRKRQKELEAAHPGAVRWRWMAEFDDIPALCGRLEDVAAKTYQRGLGAGFFDNEDFRRRLELFASRSQLRVQLLEIDGKARAFWFGTVYKGIFHSSETGYDPDLRDFEVGTLMFIRMVEALMHEGVQRLDFGLGDAHYKQRFGDRSWRETAAWLFAPTAKGVAMLLLLKLSRLLDSSARRILERAGLTDKLKTLWRRRMGKASAKTARTDAEATPDARAHAAPIGSSQDQQ